MSQKNNIETTTLNSGDHKDADSEESDEIFNDNVSCCKEQMKKGAHCSGKLCEIETTIDFTEIQGGETLNIDVAKVVGDIVLNEILKVTSDSVAKGSWKIKLQELVGNFSYKCHEESKLTPTYESIDILKANENGHSDTDIKIMNESKNILTDMEVHKKSRVQFNETQVTDVVEEGYKPIDNYKLSPEILRILCDIDAGQSSTTKLNEEETLTINKCKMNSNSIEHSSTVNLSKEKIQTIMQTEGQIKSVVKDRETVRYAELIEISGIVEQPDEDLFRTVFLETMKLGFRLEVKDVEYVFRVGPRSSNNNCPRPIVLKFHHNGIKNMLINAVNLQSLHTSDTDEAEIASFEKGQSATSRDNSVGQTIPIDSESKVKNYIDKDKVEPYNQFNAGMVTVEVLFKNALTAQVDRSLEGSGRAKHMAKATHFPCDKSNEHGNKNHLLPEENYINTKNEPYSANCYVKDLHKDLSAKSNDTPEKYLFENTKTTGSCDDLKSDANVTSSVTKLGGKDVFSGVKQMQVLSRFEGLQGFTFDGTVFKDTQRSSTTEKNNNSKVILNLNEETNCSGSNDSIFAKEFLTLSQSQNRIGVTKEHRDVFVFGSNLAQLEDKENCNIQNQISINTKLEMPQKIGCTENGVEKVFIASCKEKLVTNFDGKDEVPANQLGCKEDPNLTIGRAEQKELPNNHGSENIEFTDQNRVVVNGGIYKGLTTLLQNGGASVKEVTTSLESDKKIIPSAQFDITTFQKGNNNDIIARSKFKEVSTRMEIKIDIPDPQKEINQTNIGGITPKEFTNPLESNRVTTLHGEEYKNFKDTQKQSYELAVEARRKQVSTVLGAGTELMTIPQADTRNLISNKSEEIIGEAKPKEVTKVKCRHGSENKYVTLFKDRNQEIFSGDKCKELTTPLGNCGKILTNLREEGSRNATTPQKDPELEVSSGGVEGKEGFGGVKFKEITTPQRSGSKVDLQKDLNETSIAEGTQKEFTNPLRIESDSITTLQGDERKAVKMELVSPALESDNKLIMSSQSDVTTLKDVNNKEIIEAVKFEEVATPQRTEIKVNKSQQKEIIQANIGRSIPKEFTNSLVRNMVTTLQGDGNKNFKAIQKERYEGLAVEPERKEVSTVLESGSKLMTTPQSDIKNLISNRSKDIVGGANCKNVTSHSGSENQDVQTPQKDESQVTAGRDTCKELTILQNGGIRDILTNMQSEGSKTAFTPQKDVAFEVNSGEVYTKKESRVVKFKEVTTPERSLSKLDIPSPQKNLNQTKIPGGIHKEISNPLGIVCDSITTLQGDESKAVKPTQKEGNEAAGVEATRIDVRTIFGSARRLMKNPQADTNNQLNSRNKETIGEANSKGVTSNLRSENNYVKSPQNDGNQMSFGGARKKECTTPLVRKIKSAPTSQRKDGTRTTPPRDGEEPNCAICQAQCQNKAYANTCRHEFCFPCLSTWSQVKPECPLCKRAYTSIIYNLRDNNQYDEYRVEQVHTEDSAENARTTCAPSPSVQPQPRTQSNYLGDNYGYSTPSLPYQSQSNYLSDNYGYLTPSRPYQPQSLSPRDDTPSYYTPLRHYDSYTPSQLPKQRDTYSDFAPVSSSSLQCDVCGRVCASKPGLMSHQRAHARRGQTDSWRGSAGTFGLPSKW